jgi:multiple sugar transport system substrate-binding protein
MGMAAASRGIRGRRTTMTTIRRMILALALPFASAAFAQDVVFLSKQLRPIEEAQKVRDILLNGGLKTNFIVEEPAKLNVRVDAKQKACARPFR